MSTNLDIAESIFGEVSEWMKDYYWSIEKTPEHSFEEIKDAYIAAEKKFNNSGIKKVGTVLWYLAEIEEIFNIISSQDEERRAVEQIRTLTSHKE